MSELTVHQGIMKNERIQFFFRKHWTHFLKPCFFGVAIGLLVLFAYLLIGAVIMSFGVTFLYAFFAFLVIISAIFVINTFFLQLFNFYFNVIIVTDYRIIVARKTVFLTNDNDAIDLTKIQDIGVVAHGVFRNYLNYGALIITLSTAAPPVVISSVPNPHYYLEQMNRVKRKHILRRQEVKHTQKGKQEPDRKDYLKDVKTLELS